jgi:hypothetical protein
MRRVILLEIGRVREKSEQEIGWLSFARLPGVFTT